MKYHFIRCFGVAACSGGFHDNVSKIKSWMSVKGKNESKLESTYVSTNGIKTFDNEECLPSLPVPELNSTLLKYLDSVKPHLSKEEFSNTKSIVDDFENGVGKKLHERLLEFSKNKKNWLEKLWEEQAYLAYREPINLISMNSTLIVEEKTWPLENGTEITRAAKIVECYLEMWKLLRQVKLKPQAYGSTNFSMYQWKRIFNTTRIPGDKIDSLVTHFKTEDEGDSPRHIVVLMKGHIFYFDGIDKDGRILTSDEIKHQLQHIKKECDKLGEGPGISALTVDNRTKWHTNRKYVAELSKENKSNLDVIEKGLFSILFDENSPDADKVLQHTVFGDCQNRWYDKSANVVAFKNGAITGSSDHMPADGMIMINMLQFANMYLTEHGHDNLSNNLPEIADQELPKRLEFKLDGTIKKAINEAIEAHNENAKSIAFLTKPFTEYGKGFMKQHKMHPDAYVQLSIQLAYFLLHKKFAPTYETATTRQFYHGRTETLRSCTPEGAEWMEAMVDPNVSNDKKKELLKKAYDKHIKLMFEGMKGGGCDRHLFGLYHMAMQERLPIPDIYKDPAWIKSGGSGNFVLSTSLAGYSHMGGGTSPMCQNGYGVFYNIQEDRVTFCVSSFNSSEETDIKKYFGNINEAFNLIENLLTC